MERDVEMDAVAIDVSRLVERTVASLYSHLVTRATGRAVRMAIEQRLEEGEGASLSVIDLSEVAVLDFSCADEVVAKLLLRFGGEERPRDVFFLFRGLAPHHRDPVLAALERHELAAIASAGQGPGELLGTLPREEARIWRVLEEQGSLREAQLPHVLPDAADRALLRRLWQRRLVFRRPDREEYHALSGLARRFE